MTFDSLGLSDNLLKAIKECGYENPTPIQEQAIPQILMARDVVGLAQTGTGKTGAFTIPMIEILHGGRAKARMPRSLILSPTRELAQQIAENFDTYGKHTTLTKALLVGGTSMGDQIKKLERGVDVLIATPGRLLDLFDRGNILLSDIKVLVIDEADRMLDMGFIPDIEKIISLVPFTRQTLLFSATMPPAIKKLADNFLSSPKEVSVAAPATTAKNVEQFLVWTTKRGKKTTLKTLIDQENVKNAFIFCNRKRDIDDLRGFLAQKTDYNVAGLHGDMSQPQRNKTLQDVKDGKVDLLVCSDVAGRGIDIDGLTHVFNYDVPYNDDDYVHRIGRTGRAGNKGRAWMLAAPGDDEELVEKIEKKINKKLDVVELGDAKKSQDDPNPQKQQNKPTLNPKQKNNKSKSDFKKQSTKNRHNDNEHDDGEETADSFAGDNIPAFLRG